MACYRYGDTTKPRKIVCVSDWARLIHIQVLILNFMHIRIKITKHKEKEKLAVNSNNSIILHLDLVNAKLLVLMYPLRYGLIFINSIIPLIFR